MHQHHVDWINIIVETKHLIAPPPANERCEGVTSNLAVEPADWCQVAARSRPDL